MSKATHYIVNGDSILGVLWENEKLGRVLVTDGKIDTQFDLDIRSTESGETVQYVDLRDFLLEALPAKEQ